MASTRAPPDGVLTPFRALGPRRWGWGRVSDPPGRPRGTPGVYPSHDGGSSLVYPYSGRLVTVEAETRKGGGVVTRSSRSRFTGTGGPPPQHPPDSL